MIPDKPSSARLSTRDFFEKKFLVGIKSQKPQGVVACSHSRPRVPSVVRNRDSLVLKIGGKAGPKARVRMLVKERSQTLDSGLSAFRKVAEDLS